MTNDSSNGGVDWSCTPSTSCGAFSPAHTASGASTTYTAPSAAAAVVILAASTSNHAASVTVNVSVAAPSSSNPSGPALTSGQFVFSLRGETTNGSPYGVVGAIAVDQNGNVTGGEQNYASVGGANSPQPGGDSITGGKLTAGANGMATLTLITNNSAVGVSGTETLHMAVANSKHALIEEFDSSATSSGTLDFQTLGAGGLGTINGSYVFFVKGKRSSLEEAFGGLLTGDGAGNGRITVDVNDNGAGQHGGTNVSAYTAPDSFGRGTYTTPAATDLAYYVVNSKVFRIIAFDSGWADVGSIYAGVTNASNATLHQKFIFADASIFAAGGTFAAAGLISFDGVGAVSGFADVNENGTSTAAAFTGTYTTASSGYGSVTISPGNTQDVSALGLYLTDPTINFADPNSTATAGGGLFGIILDLDTKIVGSGELIVPAAQTALPSGKFAQALRSNNNNHEVDAVGFASITGTALTGTEDVNDLLNTGLKTALASTTSSALAADTNNAGRSRIAISLASSPAQTFNLVLYQVSPTLFLTVELDAGQFGSGFLEQQQ
ncbi:MAG TPA: hypothetical protein VFE02_19930 [Candidatus Acidoferrales bacterium]|nr:hypothetical protein [Candidatus Acidoferrales bacterium]